MIILVYQNVVSTLGDLVKKTNCDAAKNEFDVVRCFMTVINLPFGMVVKAELERIYIFPSFPFYVIKKQSEVTFR